MSAERNAFRNDPFMLELSFNWLVNLVASTSPVFVSGQDMKKVAFRFSDKERPRDYTSKVAGLLHVGHHHMTFLTAVNDGSAEG